MITCAILNQNLKSLLRYLSLESVALEKSTDVVPLARVQIDISQQNSV